MWKNYFKPTPKKLLKISLAVRGFITTISTAAYFDGNKAAAFWLLIAGSLVDLWINCIDPKKVSRPSIKQSALPVIILLISGVLLLAGCATPRKTEKQTEFHFDTTQVSYKAVPVEVKGSAVQAAINTDSMRQVIQALKDAGKTTPVLTKEIYKPVVVTDPESKVQLKYWYDEWGKLNMQCSSKDQTIQMLVAEITRLSKEKEVVKTDTVVEKKPWSLYASIGINILLVLLILYSLLWPFKR